MLVLNPKGVVVSLQGATIHHFVHLVYNHMFGTGGLTSIQIVCVGRLPLLNKILVRVRQCGSSEEAED